MENMGNNGALRSYPYLYAPVKKKKHHRHVLWVVLAVVLVLAIAAGVAFLTPWGQGLWKTVL